MTKHLPLQIQRSIGNVQALKLAPLALVLCLMTLDACNSRADGSDPASAMGGKGKVKVPPEKGGGSTNGTGSVVTSTPPPATTGTITYDTSVGNGVDGAGFADLPLHSGASRYFVNSATGSDANSCTAAKSPSTPRATITATANCVTKGAGDQILVAQGTRYGDFPNLTDMDGFSPVYPTVIQSYDPADPTNEAKIGRATGGTRPVIAKTGKWAIMMGGGTSPKYTAIRSFDFNPGNLSEQEINFFPNTNGYPDYFLFENNIVRYAAFGANLGHGGTTETAGWVIRGNAFYGAWSATPGYHSQGIFLSWVSYTLEDNVIWHAGWKIGASRDDFTENGGLGTAIAGGAIEGIFRHPIYAQLTTSGVSRRNLVIDGAADGGSYRGDILAYENLGIDNPIAMGLGGGNNYETLRPDGQTIEAHHNVFLGDAQIAGTAGAYGWGIDVTNGKPGSSIHHNVLAHAHAGNTSHAFETKADFDLPSYAYWHDNVAYQWTASGSTHTKGNFFISEVFDTYDYNKWDDSASGTNANSGSPTPPNPYTADQLYAAQGFTGSSAAARKQAFIDYVISHPEDHSKQRTMLSYALSGYGVAN
jgi:hypothetical protein